ncbi:hypothetical protein ACFSX6_16030, partial [Hymenobacter rubripertinctus]
MQHVLLAAGLLSLTLTAPAHSQQAPPLTVVDGIRQKVNAKPFAGRPYRLTARISVDTARAGKANAWIVVASFGAKRQMLTVESLPNRAVAKQWRTYTVQGKIPKKADTLMIAGLGYLDGPFGFDDFKLEVKRRRGQWEAVALGNPGFEEAASDPAGAAPAGWQPFHPTPSFTRQLVTDSTGNYYLRLQGHRATAPNRVILAGMVPSSDEL